MGTTGNSSSHSSQNTDSQNEKSNDASPETANQEKTRVEDELDGKPSYRHPYLWYIILNLLLFGFLLFAGWLALENGWIPNRGIQ